MDRYRRQGYLHESAEKRHDLTLTDGNDGKKYIGCVRPEWDMIKDSSKISDVENKIEGIRCKFAYGPGDYLIFMVII